MRTLKEVAAPGEPPNRDTYRLAMDYINERGWCVLPAAFGGKECHVPSWSTMTLDALRNNLGKYWKRGERANISVLAGTASGGLVDIDLDCSEAIQLAPYLLPPTDCRFGRASKPRSHWLYHCVESGKAQKWNSGGEVVVEYRSEGCLTILPGSRHTDEEIEWDRSGSPATVDAVDLKRDVARLAAAVALVRTFPGEGGRNNAALALAGVLARANWSEEAVVSYLGAIVTVAGHEDAVDVDEIVSRTVAKHLNGEPVTGIKALQESFGVPCTREVQNVLQLQVRPAASEVLEAANALTHNSDASEVERALALLGDSDASPLEVEEILRRLKAATNRTIPELKKALKAMRAQAMKGAPPEEECAIVAREILTTHYCGGKHLIHVGGAFGCYTGKHWKWPLEPGLLEQQALRVAQKRYPTRANRLVQSSVDTLRRECYCADNPFNDPKLVFRDDRFSTINLQNGELVVGPQGELQLTPHQPESFLTHVLPLEYDPSASAPVFEKTLNEIFAKAKDPDGLVSFTHELIGYAIQSLNRPGFFGELLS